MKTKSVKLFVLGLCAFALFGIDQVSIGSTPAQAQVARTPNYKTAWVPALDKVKVGKDALIVWADLKTQRVSVFKNKKFVVSYQVLTGSDKNPTPTGTFKISNLGEYDPDGGIELNGSYGSALVSVWNPITFADGNEIAFHNAPWRSDWEFGRTTWRPQNGSHGCINMSLLDSLDLYNRTRPGTVVYISK
jgi:lipoprotein-anchoring transpeptidase ErfK/SrfK